MGVFAEALRTSGAFLRDAALSAAHELGVFEALVRTPCTSDELARELAVAPARHRLRALLDALVAAEVLVREEARYRVREVPARPVVPRAGWGQLAEVIRTNRPLDLDAATRARYHAHLVRAGAAAARELAALLSAEVDLAPGGVLDLGGGAGTYVAALLDEVPTACATLVDDAEVLPLAADHLARFGDRVRLVAGDARAVDAGTGFGAVVLANVLHLHGPAVCAALCEAAARAVGPGGVVAIVELRLDDDRRGPPEGVWFALDMAVYTDAGDVHPTAQLRSWLADAGLVGIEERRLASTPEAVVVVGFSPRGAGAALAATTGLAAIARPIADALDARIAPRRWPAALRTMLAHALALEGSSERAAQLVRHYAELMPAQRAAQLASADAPGAALLHAPIDWARLPRLSRALDRLFALVGSAAPRALGAPSADAFRASTPTLAALYARTHYGDVMPLLYGNPADLAYFVAHGGGDAHATIDRYLTIPVLHELCHFASDRDALQPLHLDECVAGWLGVYVEPEFAYPAEGHDDAIYAAPWLAQVGQAIARAFGIAPVVRAHAGAAPWDAVLPKRFVDAAARLGWADWCERRSLHFLSDTLRPEPWVALALAAASGRALAGETPSSLARIPLGSLADDLPADPAFDRAIVEDALRAMCLDNVRVDGSFRARTRVPDAPISIDAASARVSTSRRGEIDTCAPRYWLPPSVVARLAACGLAGYELRLASVAAIPEIAAAVCAGSPGVERAQYALVARPALRDAEPG